MVTTENPLSWNQTPTTSCPFTTRTRFQSKNPQLSIAEPKMMTMQAGLTFVPITSWHVSLTMASWQLPLPLTACSGLTHSWLAGVSPTSTRSNQPYAWQHIHPLYPVIITPSAWRYVILLIAMSASSTHLPLYKYTCNTCTYLFLDDPW